MEKFTVRSIGRGVAKFMAIAPIATIAFCTVGSLHEYAEAKNTAGVESIMHQSNADQFALVGLVTLVVPAVATATLRTTILGLQFGRTEETLINYLRGPRGEEELAKKYLAGQLRFRDYILYRAILVDGFQGIQKVWDSTVSKAAGITNVDRAKLDKDVTVCIDTILVGYANSGGAGTDPSNIAGYDYVVTGWPAGLRTAEITILQDGNPLIEDLPVQSCGSMADSQFGVGRAEGYQLKNPIILEGDKNFEVRINFPQAIAGANTDFVRVDLYGVGTRKRGMI